MEKCWNEYFQPNVKMRILFQYNILNFFMVSWRVQLILKCQFELKVEQLNVAVILPNSHFEKMKFVYYHTYFQGERVSNYYYFLLTH